MALRRELMSYLGTGAIGGIIGYYARSKGLLGLKSEEEVRTPSEDEDQSPEDEDSSEDSDTETVVIDDFESGNLDTQWSDEFDSSRGGSDGGRSTFTVQSSTVAEGNYALRGDREAFSAGGSSVTRDDFTINQGDVTIELYVKIGEILDGSERGNKVHFGNDDNTNIIQIAQKSPNLYDSTTGYIAREELSSVELLELRNVSFQNQEVGEVAIADEIIETNLEFNSDTEVDSIEHIKVEQGHYSQPNDIVVDRISVIR
jgi:hypothetical protein